MYSIHINYCIYITNSSMKVQNIKTKYYYNTYTAYTLLKSINLNNLKKA